MVSRCATKNAFSACTDEQPNLSPRNFYQSTISYRKNIYYRATPKWLETSSVDMALNGDYYVSKLSRRSSSSLLIISHRWQTQIVRSSVEQQSFHIGLAKSALTWQFSLDLKLTQYLWKDLQQHHTHKYPRLLHSSSYSSVSRNPDCETSSQRCNSHRKSTTQMYECREDVCFRWHGIGNHDRDDESVDC